MATFFSEVTWWWETLSTQPCSSRLSRESSLKTRKGSSRWLLGQHLKWRYVNLSYNENFKITHAQKNLSVLNKCRSCAFKIIKISLGQGVVKKCLTKEMFYLENARWQKNYESLLGMSSLYNWVGIQDKIINRGRRPRLAMSVLNLYPIVERPHT